MVLLRAACAIVMVLVSAAAYAADHTIMIEHMEIQNVDETLNVGDNLTFENRSDMAHNLYITYSDGSVDNFDTQVPGTRRTLTLRVAGPAVIRCWIHPIIKADVNIGPQEGTQ